ncbi:MAG: NAD(P)H-hydrate dehydratase [Acidobacteriota bacterium]|nr:NAD(P)H-hydrate dehydratase [Acidobacteriota bacterium]
MKAVTAAEMNAIDRLTSEQHGVPSLTLMENAGAAVAAFVLEQWPTASRITVVCGRGNNGGDGMVAARRLHEAGKVVELLLLGPLEDLRPDPAAMVERMHNRPTVLLTSEDVVRETYQSLSDSDLIIDAIFGTGYQTRPEPSQTQQLADAAIAAINVCTAPVLSIDLPSGVNADDMTGSTLEHVCRSSAVITFTAPKPAHLFAPLTRGPMVVAQIGTPEAIVNGEQHLNIITPREVAGLFAPRPLDSNKGRFGHVMVVAGSMGKSGAAAMCSMAALRMGAGLVTAAVPGIVQPLVAGYAPELMTEGLGHSSANFFTPTDAARCLELAKSRSVLAIGPGLSQSEGVAEFVRRVVKGAHQPLVLDADGLNSFAGALKELPVQRPLVLTPHPGEMARLLGCTVSQVQAARTTAARDFARRLRCTVVLKGFRTIVATPLGELWVSATGNPGLATGGTGDILAGMIAGAIAQFPRQIDEAVWAAVYLHGLAADVAAAELGEECMVATDLLRYLPEAFRILHWRAADKKAHLGGWGR